jgi:CubicO group peptidase (beta-lactamase class C family)
MSNEVLQVPIERELDALFGQYTAAGQARGLVYGITDADGLFHTAGFGAADELGRVPGADTVFPIASMTKSFTACAALIARDRGLLSLHEPITKYVPEFSLSPGHEDVPTLEMLLGMYGGLTEDNSWVDPFISMPTGFLLALVEKGVRISHLPGAVYEYSNLGFTLASLAVSRAAGRPLDDFLREELLQPLGLNSTFCDNAVPDGVTRAVGYSLDTEGNWVPYAPQTSDAFLGAGGLVSTIRDLATWITWLGAAFRPSQASQADADRVLSRASRRDLQRIRVLAPPALSLTDGGAARTAQSGYALGLQVTTDLQRGTLLAHSGGLPGFILYMTWHPGSGHGAVVLTNSHRGNPVALCGEALGRLLSRRQAPASTITLWPETAELRGKAEELIRHWDDDLAAAIFAENVDFDQPLAQRREEIARLTAEVGPLLDSASSSVVSAASAADVTWSIPAARGELLCMIHLTPVNPARIQELVVQAVPADRPRSAAPVDISPRRRLGEAYLTPGTNVRVQFPRASR